MVADALFSSATVVASLAESEAKKIREKIGQRQ